MSQVHPNYEDINEDAYQSSFDYKKLLLLYYRVPILLMNISYTLSAYRYPNNQLQRIHQSTIQAMNNHILKIEKGRKTKIITKTF